MKPLALLLLFLFCSLRDVQAQAAFSIVASETPDTVQQGEYAKGSFVITNNSNEPVYIITVTSSISTCMPTYSKDVILPGAKTTISWLFVTQQKRGLQDRVLTATFSNDSVLLLRYRFFIVPATIDTTRIASAENSPPDTAKKQQFVLVTPTARPAPAQSQGIETHKPNPPTPPIEIIQPGEPVPQQTETIKDTACRCSCDGPLYPGGNDLFIDSVVKITKKQITPAKTGTIYVRFTINEKGEVVKPEIERSIDPAFEKVLLENMLKLGKWTPICKYTDDSGRGDCCDREPGKVELQFPVKVEAAK